MSVRDFFGSSLRYVDCDWFDGRRFLTALTTAFSDFGSGSSAIYDSPSRQSDGRPGRAASRSVPNREKNAEKATASSRSKMRSSICSKSAVGSLRTTSRESCRSFGRQGPSMLSSPFPACCPSSRSGKPATSRHLTGPSTKFCSACRTTASRAASSSSPTKRLARYLTDRVGNYEELEPYFHFGRL